MTNAGHTIETLKRKSTAELRVIFRMASEASSNAALPQTVRTQAVRTSLQVRCVLTLRR
jgi:hypothetical protein